MGYFVYILQSDVTEKFYIGSSAEPLRRLGFHNTIEKGFTARYRPWKLVFMREYQSKQEAQAVERKLKSWKSRQTILRLINAEIVL